jgi:hypothetical protein
MKQVIKLDETLTGEVVQIKDDYAVGPLTQLDTDEGWQARHDWWMSLLENSHYAGANTGKIDDRKTVKDLKEKLAAGPGEEVWIWMGQNQHDVSGYYWLMPQLRDFAGRVMILYMNNLPFINEKGQVFYPSWIEEIPPREFLKAKKLARPITLSEFEVDPDEWKKLCDENYMVRILEGGKKIIGKEDIFYDNDIIRNLTPEWQKAARVITNTLHRMKIKTGDVFLMWRLKKLISEGKIEVMGDMNKGWKDFDVKLTGVKMEVAAEAKETGE